MRSRSNIWCWQFGRATGGRESEEGEEQELKQLQQEEENEKKEGIKGRWRW
jgi:hypothetical protein